MTYDDNTVGKRVLAGWKGAYVSPDEWRMSSDIQEIEEKDDWFIFHNLSGSKYFCAKSRYGFTGLSAEIFEKYKKQYPNQTFDLVDGYGYGKRGTPIY
jgi:hypothetical protein